MESSRRSSLPFWIVLLPFLALVARFDFLTDDAFISFRYSRNLAAGLGLRYNLGVDPPVEGFSNLLWVLWLAAIDFVNLDMLLWSRITSIGCGVALLWRVATVIQRRMTRDRVVATCSLLTLVTLPPFALWSSGGLATMPFALAIFLAFEALLGDPKRPRGVRTGLLFVATSLVRADGPVLVALILVAAGVQWLSQGRPRQLFRAMAVAVAIFALGFAALLAWRYSYFGDFVPNTAHVKVGVTPAVLHRGVNYVAIFLLTFLSVPLLALVSLKGAGRPTGGLATQALILVLGLLAYTISVGGDFMCMERFLVPALPFLTLLFCGGLARVAAASRTALFGWTGAAVLLSLLPGWNVHLIPHSVRAAFHFRWRVDEHQTEYERWIEQKDYTRKWSFVGRALAEYAQPGESLVVPHIGAIGYYSDLFILDRKGLVHREVARQVPPSDRQSPGHSIRAPLSFFAKDEPTYMLAVVVTPENPEAWAANKFRTLFTEFEEDEPLLALYESVLVVLDPADGYDPGMILWLAARKR